MKTVVETPMRLLDLLEAHRGWDFVDGGEVWSVTAWTAEWTAGTEHGDRGPVVTVREERDGHYIVLALDEEDRPMELVGVLAREG